MKQSIGPRLRKHWQFLSTKPFGKWLFSRLVGWSAPYSASISANVLHLEPGLGIITLKDHRKVRNHLQSIHAIALANLAEMVTGLTLMNSLPDNMRGILTGMQMQYHKKARGLLSAQCRCEIPRMNTENEILVTGEIKDADGELVASASASWLIGPETFK
jgi:acyl-coenzyme A thioesterase PaaI-like protein